MRPHHCPTWEDPDGCRCISAEVLRQSVVKISLYSCGSCGYSLAVTPEAYGRMTPHASAELRRSVHFAHADICPGVTYCDVHPTYVVLPNATEGLRPWCTAGHVANLPTVSNAGDRITELLQEVPC